MNMVGAAPREDEEDDDDDDQGAVVMVVVTRLWMVVDGTNDSPTLARRTVMITRVDSIRTMLVQVISREFLPILVCDCIDWELLGLGRERWARGGYLEVAGRRGGGGAAW